MNEEQLRVGVITQARMGSSRLPGKVLLPAGAQPLLSYHVNRLLRADFQVYVATTIQSSDEPIVCFCADKGLPFYRGSEEDVLSRYYETALTYQLDVIIRVTSDCPFIDGQLIHQGLRVFLAAQADKKYLSNGIICTFPRGFDFEIFTFSFLEEAFQKADLPYEREHVTPYMYVREHSDALIVPFTQNVDKSMYRVTLDVQEDYVLIRELIENYEAGHLSQAEIVQILDDHPELVAINSHVEQKQLPL